MKKNLVLLVFFFTVLGTAQNYVSTLKDKKTFDILKGKPLTDKFSNIESLKIVYDLKTRKLYYFNSIQSKLHFDFVVNYLSYSGDIEQFNRENYSDNEKARDFLLGNINHIKGKDKWVLELAASDHMPIKLIEFLYKEVEKSSFIGNKLKFYLNNQVKIEAFEKKEFNIPCVKSDYIFNELEYQEVSAGSCVGILKYYTLKQLDSIQPKKDEIIVLDGTPDLLPNVKGIIVNELQTPLSHLVILGKNRKIPIMAYKKAQTDYRLKNLNNEKVELKILVDTFYIAKSDKKITYKNQSNLIKLKSDLTVKELVDLSNSSKNNSNSIGAKAQNLAYLIDISKELKIKTPENAFAIPFHYYKEHVKHKKIDGLISKLKDIHKDSTQLINNQLKKIRSEIKKQPINQKLIKLVTSRISSQTDFKNFRFRSSTNAEDIDDFNGAGLYESKTGILGDTVKTFEKAIKQVWASVWNESSYWERELFGIDQNSIAMGVLVHRAFPDEIANGVIITKNLHRTDLPGITVNIQHGENSVVKPAKGEVCEQFTIYDFNEFNTRKHEYEVDYISHSNLNNNQNLMNKEEINSLYEVCKKIERKMNRCWNNLTNKPVDIEFKIIGKERTIYIKQVRPFNN
ncbi:PEP/pyruvate-binding domain-containing protein [Flavobacterium urocaniciphilum]|uniref:Phosphoenolpyruvate synthase n=1 Tax=Flavobacterium urocaniciphilum TaxID=1299341 RepID=A0A1H8Z4B2_9FLAO|nr:PEP/pyruvate-binding domain-containing protein [Flavobacterium urocaniciphilum]SEP59182.1 Pyruvate phosphate dikinase, PEP/pyruvate binding domain [Flavobacterium urocaniciphilum]